MSKNITKPTNATSEPILEAVQKLMQQLNDETIIKLNTKIKLLEFNAAQLNKDNAKLELKLARKQAELLNQKKIFTAKIALLKHNHADITKDLHRQLSQTSRAYYKLCNKSDTTKSWDASVQLPDQVYQFKITLNEIKPAIWRRIQVPANYTFWAVHVAIQNAMGWTDSHLHQFELYNPKTKQQEIIGIPESAYDWVPCEGEDFNTLPGRELKLADYLLSGDNNQITYTYDFGDNWHHTILFEGIHPITTKIKYPICLAGERACPPEDCGGTMGYENFLQIINDPHHKEYRQTRAWVGGKFAAEKCLPEKIRFENPQRRFNTAWGE